MFRTDFPYVTGNLGQFTIIRGKQGRASKETGAWKCTDVRFLDSWSDEDNDEKGLVLRRKFRRGDEEANWWTPISTPELPFAAFRPCIIVAFALNTRIPSPSCGNAAVSRIKRPSAYLSYPPRRIPRNSMLGRFLLHLGREFALSRAKSFHLVRFVARLFESWEEFLRLVVREMG